jgi:hypothetical protein
MTAFLSRRQPASRPRRRILEVTNTWHVGGVEPLRLVVVRDYDGQTRRTWMPDEHPALVAFLDRAAAVAA